MSEINILSASGLIRGDSDKPVNDWPTIRLWILERDSYLCQICKLRSATDVDHIWPRRLGGEDHVSNLRAACGMCNKTKGDRVDLDTASDWDLLRGIDALRQRMEAFEVEAEQMENLLLVRAMISGRSRAALVQYVATAGARVARLEQIRERCEQAMKAIDLGEVAQ